MEDCYVKEFINGNSGQTETATCAQHLGLGKPLHREALRRLPLPEKVRIVVELQKIAAPILRARRRKPVVWKI